MKHQQKQKGIVLLEAIIAVGVLATIFTAAMALYMASVGGVRMTNDQVTATYLAQEAMEIVIAKRQHNYENSVGGVNWLDGLSGCTTASPCDVSFDDDITLSNPFSNCGGSCPLYLDSGVYNPDSGTITPFSRSISVQMVNAYTARVEAKVWWMDGADTFEYSLWHTMYDNPN